MKPVDQHTTYDCLRACVASIFETDDVPCFGESAIGTETEAVQQDSDFRKWLAARGVSLHYVTNPEIVFAKGGKSAESPWGLCIASGKSPRGDFHHAVVYDYRKRGTQNIVHDPHPSRLGLDGIPEHFTCFLLEDPSLLTRESVQ